MWEYRFNDLAQGRLVAEAVLPYDVAVMPQPDTAAQSLIDLYGVPRPRAVWTALTGPPPPQFGDFLKTKLAEWKSAFSTFSNDKQWQIRRGAAHLSILPDCST